MILILYEISLIVYIIYKVKLIVIVLKFHHNCLILLPRSSCDISLHGTFPVFFEQSIFHILE